MAALPSLDKLLERVPSQKLDKPCKDIHLCKIAQSITDWKVIAPFLGLSEAEENDIERDERKSSAQKRAMVRLWRKKCGTEATYRRLAKVFFDDLQQASLVDAICEALLDNDGNTNIFERYNNHLKSKYVNELPSTPLCLPTPTRKVFNLAMIHRMPVQQVPVSEDHIKQTQMGKVDDIMLSKTGITLEDIFNPQYKRNIEGRTIILIEGAPGAGKSTLAWYICKRWGSGSLFSEFKLVVFVQLRDPVIGSATSVADILPGMANNQQREVLSKLEARNGKGILFVLDGWDEYAKGLSRDSICGKLICRPGGLSMQESTVLITSRPVASGELQIFCSTRIEIIGFTPAEVSEYFGEALSEAHQQGQHTALQKCLEVRPVIRASCYLPLNAAIVVHVFITEGNTLPTTLHGLFTTIVLNCIVRHLKREREGEGKRLLRLKSLDDIPVEIQPYFSSICALAFHGIENNKASFSEEDLRSVQLSTDTPVQLLSLIQGWSTFRSSWEELSYSFNHLSVQEFLAAYHIHKHYSPSEQVQILRSLFNQHQLTAVLQFYAAFTKFEAEEIRTFLREQLTCHDSIPVYQCNSSNASRLNHSVMGHPCEDQEEDSSAKISGSDFIDDQAKENLSSAVDDSENASSTDNDSDLSALEYEYEDHSFSGANHETILDCLYEAQDPPLCQYVAGVMDNELTVDYTVSPLHCMALGYFLCCIAPTDRHRKFHLHFHNCGLDKDKCTYLINELEKCRGGQLVLSLDIGGEAESAIAIHDTLEEKCFHCISELNISARGFSRDALAQSQFLLTQNCRIPQVSLDLTATDNCEVQVKREWDRTGLKTLKLWGTKIALRPETLSNVLAVHTAMNEVNLSGSVMGLISGKSVFAALATNTTLKSLRLSRCDVPAEYMDELSYALEENSTLKSLDLSHFEISAQSMEALSQALSTNTSLETLRLSTCALQSEHITILAAGLAANVGVNMLELSPCGCLKEMRLYMELQETLLSLRGATALADALTKNTTLKTLELTRCEIPTESVEALCHALTNNSALKALHLPGCMIKPEGIQALAGSLARSPVLKELNLSWCELSVDDLRALSGSLFTNTKLKVLVLSHNYFGEYGLCLITEAVKANSSLKSLDISDCSLGGPMLEHLVTACETMETLILSGNDLSSTDCGHTGAYYLAKGLRQNTSLRRLSIERCKLTDYTLRITVRALVPHPLLQEINFGGNPFTISELTRLSKDLKRVHCLQKVTLGYLGFISEASNEELTSFVHELSNSKIKCVYTCM